MHVLHLPVMKHSRCSLFGCSSQIIETEHHNWVLYVYNNVILVIQVHFDSIIMWKSRCGTIICDKCVFTLPHINYWPEINTTVEWKWLEFSIIISDTSFYISSNMSLFMMMYTKLTILCGIWPILTPRFNVFNYYTISYIISVPQKWHLTSHPTLQFWKNSSGNSIKFIIHLLDDHPILWALR